MAAQLYYPQGFTEGDGSLEVLPGSHRVVPDEFKALSAGSAPPDGANRPHLSDAAAKKFGLAPHTFSASPGSMVFLNARCYHGVAAQRPDSPQAHRGFCNVRPQPAPSTCAPRISFFFPPGDRSSS